MSMGIETVWHTARHALTKLYGQANSLCAKHELHGNMVSVA